MKNPLKNAVQKITSSENVKKIVSSATDKVTDKIAETVENINAEISAREEERKRKNLETMNEIRFNSKHLSDLELLTLIKDTSIDKFRRIGYAAAFADRHSDRNGDKKCR